MTPQHRFAAKQLIDAFDGTPTTAVADLICLNDAIELLRELVTEPVQEPGTLDKRIAAIATDRDYWREQVVEPDANRGWLEAAIAWEVCASIHQTWAKGKDALFKTRQADFVKHAKVARQKATVAYLGRL